MQLPQIFNLLKNKQINCICEVQQNEACLYKVLIKNSMMSFKKKEIPWESSG